MQMYEYIIIGDTIRFKNCLIYCGFKTEEQTQKRLYRILNNPNQEDERYTKSHFNIRVVKVDSKRCWWNKSYNE